MGKFNFQFTNGFKIVIGVIILGLVGGGLYLWAPGLRLDKSKVLDELAVDETNVDNVDKSPLLPLPTDKRSSLVAEKPLVRIVAYAWNAQSGIIEATGGKFTTKGSLMEQNGVNLNFVRQDWLKEIRNAQTLFVTEFDKGVAYPKNEKAAFGCIIMGDGAAFYISTAQKEFDDKFGKGKYHLEAVGAVGLSYGEDKLIGKPEWKTNPQSMLGSLISVVVGDGDWVTIVNYCSANKLKVNPNFDTYDAEAVNFYPSENDDYMKSAEELIKSQTTGWTVNLKVVKDGVLTGETIDKQIDGCGTWTPGDALVFEKLNGFTDIVTTKDFNNQMAATLIVVAEWAKQPQNAAIITNILKSSYTAANQIKQHEEWRRDAAQTVSEVYGIKNADYWYDMFKGQSGEKAGVTYNVGGSRVFTYADALQYYGLSGDGVNRYKSVYTQVGKYLTELNPFGFNDAVDGVTPYEKAVNLDYLKDVDVDDAGTAYKSDYTETKKELFASGNWQINFATGSSVILPSSDATLEDLYNILVQSENAKLVIEGHTDNTGNPDKNLTLSKQRAEAVYTYLLERNVPVERFTNDGTRQVFGKGQDEPVADNSTNAGKAKNRRVVVKLLK